MEGFFCELVGYISMKLQNYCRDAVYFSIALFVFLQKTSFLTIYKLVVKIVHMPRHAIWYLSSVNIFCLSYFNCNYIRHFYLLSKQIQIKPFSDLFTHPVLQP